MNVISAPLFDGREGLSTGALDMNAGIDKWSMAPPRAGSIIDHLFMPARGVV